MIRHTGTGDTPFSRSKKLLQLIRSGRLSLGGNRIDKIYGTLLCRSGRRMKVQNRVFFTDEPEALKAGYRPCAHCMPGAYQAWKAGRK